MKQNNIQFYKYREKFSYGKGEWQYICFPYDFSYSQRDVVKESEIRQMIKDDVEERFGSSEQYRGTEVIKVNKIDKKLENIVREKIDFNEQRIKSLSKHYQEYINSLYKFIEQIY